tara:strand:+ start:545 stop:967 length:423 start_codon:yes stop_codon:yes gene_type:complete
MIVKIKKLHPDAVVPAYAKAGDAAVDLVAVDRYIDEYHNIVFDTGLAIEIPYGFVGLLFPRSSVSKTDLSLANSVGVIDSGYRGPVMLKYRRQGTMNRKWGIGDRVGQLMIIPYPEVEFIEADELSTTDRGSGGFGSTGL